MKNQPSKSKTKYLSRSFLGDVRQNDPISSPAFFIIMSAIILVFLPKKTVTNKDKIILKKGGGWIILSFIILSISCCNFNQLKSTQSQVFQYSV